MGDKMAVPAVQSRNEIPSRPKKSRIQVKIKLMCSFGHKDIVHLYNNSTNNCTHKYLNWFIHTMGYYMFWLTMWPSSGIYNKKVRYSRSTK